MATPRRTFPIYEVWEQWALAGTLALMTGHPAMVALFLRATTTVTALGMAGAGMRPASHPTSTTKD